MLTSLFSRTADAEGFVRHIAVEVLSRLVEEGDPEALLVPPRSCVNLNQLFKFHMFCVFF